MNKYENTYCKLFDIKKNWILCKQIDKVTYVKQWKSGFQLSVFVNGEVMEEASVLDRLGGRVQSCVQQLFSLLLCKRFTVKGKTLKKILIVKMPWWTLNI